MKNVLIIGFGEIGKSMYNIIKKSGKFNLFKKDIEELDLNCAVDIMHICIPFFDNFVEVCCEYINKYKPKLTIINSTVRPRVTEKVYNKTKALIVHSPVRGKHPHLEDGILKFLRFIGPTSKGAGELAKEHFDEINVKSEILKSSTETELGKLFSTTYYAINIAFHQEMDRICEKFGADFKQAVTRFNETCTMDINHKVPRPIMFPGVIEGHCLIQNIHILKEDIKSKFLDAILESNDLTKKRVERNKG